MSKDILDDIDDLIKQATTEQSHFYTASTLLRAKAEIVRLREYEWMYKELNR